MTIDIETSLLELKSRRTQLEIQLLGLSRRRSEAADAAGVSNADAKSRLEQEIASTDARIRRLELGELDGAIDDLSAHSLSTSAELEQMRARILDQLRELASPLRDYQLFAERQRRLAGKIASATGRDNRYATYIDTALLRSGDVCDELRFVLDALRNARIVS